MSQNTVSHRIRREMSGGVPDAPWIVPPDAIPTAERLRTALTEIDRLQEELNATRAKLETAKRRPGKTGPQKIGGTAP